MTFVDQLQPTAMSFLVKHLHHLAVLEPFDLSAVIIASHRHAAPALDLCAVRRRGRGSSLLVPSNFDDVLADAWLTDGLRSAKRNEVMTDPSERTVNGRRYIYGWLYKATDYLEVPPCS